MLDSLWIYKVHGKLILIVARRRPPRENLGGESSINSLIAISRRGLRDEKVIRFFRICVSEMQLSLVR